MEGEVLHGPSSSAERLSHLRSRKQLEAGRNYWRQRIQQLQNQAPRAESTFLAGVVAYVEGFSQETTSYNLQKMVYANGGKVSHYLSLTKITHAILPNLSGIKAQDFLRKKTKNGIKVVRPEWLIESCEQRRKLPEGPFLLLQDSSNQTLPTFFLKRKREDKVENMQKDNENENSIKDSKKNNEIRNTSEQSVATQQQKKESINGKKHCTDTGLEKNTCAIQNFIPYIYNNNNSNENNKSENNNNNNNTKNNYIHNDNSDTHNIDNNNNKGTRNHMRHCKTKQGTKKGKEKKPQKISRAKLVKFSPNYEQISKLPMANSTVS